MAMIGANLSIPAIAVLKPGEALPTDLLAQDLGDAGGEKLYHDSNGVLLYNDQQLLDNSNLNSIVGDVPEGWSPGAAGGRTYTDQGTYHEVLFDAVDSRPYLGQTVSGVTVDAFHAFFAYIGAASISAGEQLIMATSGETINARMSVADDYVGPGWYACAIKPASDSLFARFGVGTLSNGTGTASMSRVGIVNGLLPEMTTDGQAVRLSYDPRYIGTNFGEGPAFKYRDDAYYWDGAAWTYGGLLTEEMGLDEIRNSTMQGAATGTPGTMPTNWSADQSLNGLTRSITEIGIEDGHDFIDINYSGTTTAAGNIFVLFELNQIISATQGDDRTVPIYMRVSGGDMTGITETLVGFDENEADGSYAGTNHRQIFTPDDVLKRYSISATIVQALAAYVRPYFRFSYANNAAVDVTFRIALPDSKAKLFADSPVKTFGAAVDRKADIGQVTGQELVGTEGSIVAEIRPYIAARGSRQYAFKARAADDQDFVSLFISGAGQATIEHRHGGVYVTDSFAGKTLSDETVHRIAMSWDGTGLSISVDGLTTESVAVTGVFVQALVENYYGARELGLDPYNGFIPSLLAFDYKMDATELEQRSSL